MQRYKSSVLAIRPLNVHMHTCRKSKVKGDKTTAYIQQASVAEDAEQGVNVALAREVEACADVTPRRHDTPRIPEHQGGGRDTSE